MNAYLLAVNKARTPKQMQFLLNRTEGVERWVAPFRLRPFSFQTAN